MPRLSTIIGHDDAIVRLRAVIAQNRVGHAYLFVGPRGVGKTTTARAFAKTLNCESAAALIAGPADACDVCAACRQTDAGVHPDIHLVQPALVAAEAEGGQSSTEIRIAQIRDLNSRLNLTPSIGRRKVFIVAPAEAMNEQAQNALLKSLEEPPAFSTVILCAESAESVLATIRSRCQTLPFGLTTRPVIQIRLRELFGLGEEEAAAIAALSQGKVGLAIRYANNPELLRSRAELIGLLLDSLSGGSLKALQAAPLLREAASQVPMIEIGLAGAAAAISDKVAARLQIQMLFEELANLVRDLLILRQPRSEAAEEILINWDRRKELELLTRKRETSRLLKALDSILTAQDLLRRNVTPQLLLEDVMLDLAA